ncbi:sporulation protein YqfD [Salsuginibacillus kocurii]|uniref:sporulation protein YqfD n=1 Tax=Salsuginibacillus kocurii TaxID=427078 RepID=UPI000369CC61|nr:sporulation protein YqfD [Salsuginibacillus kocurii]
MGLNPLHNSGKVEIYIQGESIDGLLNTCLREGIVLFDVERLKDYEWRCWVYPKDIKKLRHLIKPHQCSMRFGKRVGLFFWLMGLMKRKSFVAGFFFFIALIYTSSQFVWSVDVSGGDKDIQHEVQQWATSQGIEPGAWQFRLPSNEDIQRNLLQEVEGVVWVGIDSRGTSYHFQIVEETLPDPREEADVQNIVSTKTAVIHNIYAEHGVPVVEPQQFVNRGDLLISGNLVFDKTQDEEDTEPVLASAEGEVIGEVWYKMDVSLPLERNVRTLTGEAHSEYHLVGWDHSLPVWGFFNETEVSQALKGVEETNWSLFGYDLPFQIQKETFYDTQVEDILEDKEAVIRTVQELGRYMLRKQLPEEGEIKGENILHTEVDNGKVNVSVHYRVHEDISRQVPITQGE